MKTLAIIPARYASRRFPGKPLAQIGEKSLIRLTWENAKEWPELEEILVATDDRRIFEHVQAFGGRAVMTKEAASGTDRIAEVLELRPELLEADCILNIQGDLPTIERKAALPLLKALEEDPSAVMATAATLLLSEEEAMSPHVVKCAIDLQGNALYFSRGLIPFGSGRYNPDLLYYHHLGIYAYRPSFLRRWKELKPTPLQLAEDLEQLKVLEHGYRIKVSLVRSKSFGIDSLEDLEKLKKRL